jgi:hypothetical protein
MICRNCEKLIKREIKIKLREVKTIDCMAYICADLDKCDGRKLLADLKKCLWLERSKREDLERGCL